MSTGVKTILGLDLGTHTGWCRMVSVDGAQHIDASNMYDLKRMQSLEGSVGRWVGFLTLLNEYGGDVDGVAYEYVQPSVHTGSIAARVYGALLCCLELWAREHHATLIPVKISAVKRALTGTSGASKKLMMAAARKRFRTHVVSSDHADAIGVALAGFQELMKVN